MFKKYIARIEERAYQEGYERGKQDGIRNERIAVNTMLERNTDMNEFRVTAKNKETRAAADGMKIGYDFAVSLVRGRK